MSTASRVVVVLAAAAILDAQTPPANAAFQNVPPEPVISCQGYVEAYSRALAEILNAAQHATMSEKRILHLDLVELRRDRDLEPPTC